MLPAQWLPALLVTAVAMHALLAYGIYRAVSRAFDTAADRIPPRAADVVDAEAGLVVCPGCGVENDDAYRYCRGCATALPRVGTSGRAVAPSGD